MEGVQVADTGKLRRQNGMVAGVCGGLAEWMGINVFWFRLAFLLLLIPGGLPGLLPYFILWIVIPRK
jgi:phage shock protein PspC (stress-responsive transcriptional regulator)